MIKRTPSVHLNSLDLNSPGLGGFVKKFVEFVSDRLSL